MGQTASAQLSPEGIVVVHMNGPVDEFLAPLKVKEVLSKHLSRSYFVCRWRDLQLYLHALNPLREEEELRKGEIYMVLPVSVLDSDVSPRDLAAVGNRMLVTAKRQASKRRCRRRKDRECKMDCKMFGKVVEKCENGEMEMAYREHVEVMAKRRSWKPALHTIQETCLAQ